MKKEIKILVILFIIVLLGSFLLVTKVTTNNKNCYYEEYDELPCEGATHYARVHRNNNEPCKRYRAICYK